jgi:hypothetical protein
MTRHIWAHRHAYVALLLTFLGCFGFRVFAFKNFPLDDAYIHLSYGKYFQWHNLFSFNGHHPDTGTSSWAWTILCIAIEQLRLPHHPALLTAGFLSLAWVLHGTMKLTESVAAETVIWGAPLWPYLAAATVVTNGNVVWLALSGMETVFFVAVALAFMLRMFTGPGLDGWTAALASLLILTRIEGVIWVTGSLGLLVFVPSGRRGRPAWILAPLGALALQVIYNRRVGGKALPTTAAGKIATFVKSGHDWAEERAFFVAVDRDYIRPNLPGWRFQLSVVVASAVTLLALVALSRLWRLLRRQPQPRVAPHALLLVGVIGGMMAHTIAYTVHFRTLYHHARYFAPLLITVAGVMVPLFVLVMGRLRASLGRAGIPLAVAAPPLCFAATAGAVHLNLSIYSAWKDLYTENVRQIRAVHLAAGQWLRSHRDLFPNGKVASFDIGALRYFSGYELVDLGGLLDATALAYRVKGDPTGYIAEAKPDAYVSLENGWDHVRDEGRSRGMSMEHVRGWQYREYWDPFPPHSKRMVLYRVNHCGQPRRIRNVVGSRISFDAVDDKSTATGDAFLDWPIVSERIPRGIRGEKGGYLSSFGRKNGDRARGEWTSPPMDVVGEWLSFRIAGGVDPRRLAVQLLADDGRVLRSWTGYKTNSFFQEVFSLEGLRGKAIRLRVVDRRTEAWGYIAVDEVEQFAWASRPAQPCRK